ncbi:hypothetical protein M1328_05300 [Patescibacteria group bacterium]|nr:hypothetical protein [Patescibacteria group bacterium]
MNIELLNKIPEVKKFSSLEKDGVFLFRQFDQLGIWQGLDRINRIEPALRCATLATNAAIRLNEIAELAGIDPLVSPKATFLTGLLFKSGQAIDDSIVKRYDLNRSDPHLLHLYKFPSYVPERTIETSNVLKLALLLERLGHREYAELVLHGPHPKFFEEAKLPTVLVSLANANLGLDKDNTWHSYLHPAVNLLAIEPYAVRSDELPPSQSKDWIDRVQMVAINTALQHALRMNAGINFSDQFFGSSHEEIIERWVVVGELCKQLGIPLPTEEDYVLQNKKLPLLKRWVEENNIVDRLKSTELEGKHALYSHSENVSKLMSHLAKEINKLSVECGGKPLLNEEYLGLIGLCHDCIKAFDEEEVRWLEQFKGYEVEFMHTYPSEVVARGTVSLKTSHDAKLYAWLRHFEDDNLSPHERGKSLGIASDFLSGPYHLSSFVSALLSYSDLSVTKEDGKTVFKPDITERFIDTTLKYVSDQHTAIISYAKLMTVAASLSWYLRLPLPKDGSTDILDGATEVLEVLPINDSQAAKKNLSNIAHVLSIFGISLPKELKQ